MAKAKDTNTTATTIESLQKTLWATADKLRANMDAAEYKHIVLGLIFIKYISIVSPPTAKAWWRAYKMKTTNCILLTPAKTI